MRGVARSFWAVVAIVAAGEIFIAALAIRAVVNDLPCWTSTLRVQGDTIGYCNASVAFVGYRSWIPAIAALCVFAATAAVGVWTFAIQYLHTRSALRHLGPTLPTPPDLMRQERELAIVVRLRDDDRCFCCCTGLVRPIVLISTGMRDLLDDEELTAVLAHEAAHVRHRDPARALAVRCATNAFFYFPLVRHLAKRALVAWELGADSAAVNAAGRPALVRALLDVLGRARPVLGTVSEMASLDSLDTRIEALRTQRLPRSRPRKLVVGVSALVICGMVALGFWLPGPAPHIIERPAHLVAPATSD